MKTKFKVLAGCAVAAIATVATVNVSLSMKSDRQQLSDLQLANVEALASGEGDDDRCPKALDVSSCTDKTTLICHGNNGRDIKSIRTTESTVCSGLYHPSSSAPCCSQGEVVSYSTPEDIVCTEYHTGC